MTSHRPPKRDGLRPAAIRPFLAMILSLLAIMLSPAAFAAGGENIVLDFNSSELIYLYASLAFGVIALVVAFALYKKVNAIEAGSAKMQEIGKAIREGALAYLLRQVKTMVVFVLILFVGLFLLDYQKYGVTVGLLTGISFLGGVFASYIAGYVGMLMAVAANMRVANAALTSYRRSLETAFQSGAVAGLVTVGMGLIGATLILWLGGNDAMKLLVGFGFGGSLAALFMRVGGGIFTKAADVGADLVGKVEAGIPEDDPRNPATIADNVGDNVGDCAGMAADVFESYEVTLVAAIILGAATAAIFPTEVWTRLILFALMARGVGIIASVIGIFSVKGSDNVDSDPLLAIRKGFYVAAAAAFAFTVGLAYWMMGGVGSPIQTTTLVSVDEVREKEATTIKAIRRDLAAKEKVADYRISEQKIIDSAEFKKLAEDSKWKSEEYTTKIQTALQPSPTPAVSQKLEGFAPLDFRRGNNPALNFTTIRPENEPQPPQAEPDFDRIIVSVKEGYGAADTPKLVMGVVEETINMPPPPAERGQPAPTTPPAQVNTYFLGPTTEGMLNQYISGPGGQRKLVKTVPVRLFASPNGDLAFGIDGNPKDYPAVNPAMNPGGIQAFFFRQPTAEFRTEVKSFRDKMMELQRSNANPMQQPPSPLLAQQESIKIAFVERQTVPWWLFAIAIGFGLLMAFAIELLTDYYVSTHKKPVKEVAGVSTAGPAPMIIQGFALAMESSVFMVFAIVVALLFPLFLFPPDLYGGYLLSFYGIALVGLGLLATTGYILAMDTFGPISDNAQGVYEMSGEGHDNAYGSKAVQRLDAAGNTTKALTKGFAIATAVVAAVALFHTYLESAKLQAVGLRLDLPEIFLGLLIGGAAPYLFSAFSINAVGRASFELINEVRRQFRTDPGIMLGTSKPDYGTCVAIVTKAAQRELLSPGLLAIALPIAVGFGFSIGKAPIEVNGVMVNLAGAQALGGFLAGIIISGQLMAVLLSNAGGIWDNSKKLIEDGLFGGKGTEAHKAGVVCDTVGDPFKDTAGPALNPLIKVMNLVSLLLAPTIILPHSDTVLIIVTSVSVILLVVAVVLSKSGSMAEGFQAAGGSPPPGVPPVASPDPVDSAPIDGGPVNPAAEETAPNPTPGKRRLTVEDEEPTS